MNHNYKSLIKKSLQFLFFLGLGCLFIWLSVRNLTPHDIEALKQSTVSVFQTNRWLWLIPAIITGVLSHYIRGLRSILLIDASGYHIKKSMSFYAVMVGYFGNLGFPRAGEVLRCTYLQQYASVPFQKSISTIINERVVDIILFFLLLIIAILLNTQAIMGIEYDGQTIKDILIAKIEGIVFSYKIWIILGILTLLTTIIIKFRKQLLTIKILRKTDLFFQEIWKGLISIRYLKNPFLFVCYSFLIWIFYYLTTFFTFFCFDFLGNMGFIPPFLCLVYGSFGFMIAQGGIGAYPVIVAGTLVLYNIPYPQALAAGWLGWGMQTLMYIVLGTFAILLGSFFKRKTNKS